jgi:hypothetical protein
MELMYSSNGKTHVLRTGSYTKTEALCGSIGELSRGRCVKMREGDLITCRTCLKLWYKEHHDAIKPFTETTMVGPVSCPECHRKGMHVGIRLAEVLVYCEKCGHKAKYELKRDGDTGHNYTHSAMRAFGADQ